MNDSAPVALLVVLAVAYIGGAALMVANLGKILGRPPPRLLPNFETVRALG